MPSQDSPLQRTNTNELIDDDPTTFLVQLEKQRSLTTEVPAGVTLSFNDVAVIRQKMFSRKGAVVLQGLIGLLAPGTVHAILSPSIDTANRSLHVLAGSAGIVTGSVKANGVPVISKAFRTGVGFVDTHDNTVAELSVEANLRFRLDMAMKYPDYSLIERCCKLLHINASDKVKNLGKQQRRRVNIAMELVTDPSVLFVVDPLDRIDLHNAAKLIRRLNLIAKATQKTIVVSLSSVHWFMCEHLETAVLLSRGQTVYSGKLAELPTYFRDQGADADACGSCEAVLDMVYGWNETASMVYAAKWYDSGARQELAAAIIESEAEALHSGHLTHNEVQLVPKPSVLAKIWGLISFDARGLPHQRDFLVAWAVLFVILGVCVGLSSEQRYNQEGMMNQRGIIFILFSSLLNVNLMFMESWWQEKCVFTHHRDGGYYNTPIFLMLIVLKLALTRTLFLSVFMAFVYIFMGAQSALVVLLGATSFTHATLILLIVFLSPSIRAANFVQNVVFILNLIFSGFLINMTSLPEAVGKLSIMRYGYGGAVAYALKDRPYSCESLHILNMTSYCYTGNEYLELQGFHEDDLKTNVTALAVISLCVLAAVGVRMALMKAV